MDAIRRINTRPFNWRIATHNTTLAADTREYVGPADFGKPYVAIFLDSDDRQQETLTWVPPKSFDEERAYGGGISLGHWFYTIFNYRTDAKLTIGSDISSSKAATTPTLRLRYYKNIPYPTKDSEVLQIPAEAESFVIWHAKGYAAGILAPSREGSAVARAEDAWKRIGQADDDITDY